MLDSVSKSQSPAIGKRVTVARNAHTNTSPRSPATNKTVGSCLALLNPGRCSNAIVVTGDTCKLNASSFFGGSIRVQNLPTRLAEELGCDAVRVANGFHVAPVHADSEG